MAKEKIIDYQKAMDEYEKSRGKKTDDVIIPLADKILPNGGVDYQAATREFRKYLKDKTTEDVKE